MPLFRPPNIEELKQKRAALSLAVVLLGTACTAGEEAAPTRTRTPEMSERAELPAECGLVGVGAHPEASPTPDSRLHPRPRGIRLTVTTRSDVSNGDVSTASGLLTNPGPDGISLREALDVSKFDPGQYTIRFARSLAGTTIALGDLLPPLEGGGVLIDGDINGDGRPDVTLKNARPRVVDVGLMISSSHNWIHALALRGFRHAVAGLLDPEVTAPLKDNTVSNTVTGSSDSAISFQATSPLQEVSGSGWIDTKIVGNTIKTGFQGIGVTLAAGGSGSVAKELEITGNRIRGTGVADSTGIDLGAGFFVGGSTNRISDVLIAHNSIEGALDLGMRIFAGDVGASANVLKRIRILENEVRVTGRGISVTNGDQATDYVAPDYKPITYPEENLIRGLEIVGNLLEHGADKFGVILFAGLDGAANNTVEDVRLEDNLIQASGPPGGAGDATGVAIWAAGSSTFSTRSSTNNRVSNVSIRGNTITRERGSPPDGLLSGGVLVVGGVGAQDGTVEDVRVTNNEIDTEVVGINVMGGIDNSLEGPNPPTLASGNTVSRVEIGCNRVLRRPELLLTDSRYSWIKGISVLGGIGESTATTDNHVTCLLVADNDVAAVANDLSIRPDVGPEASANSVETSPC